MLHRGRSGLARWLTPCTTQWSLDSQMFRMLFVALMLSVSFAGTDEPAAPKLISVSGLGRRDYQTATRFRTRHGANRDRTDLLWPPA